MHSLSAVLFAAVTCALLWLAFSVSGWLHVRHSWKKSVTWHDYRRFYNAVQRADEATIRDVARKYGAVIALLLALSVAAPLMAASPGMNIPRQPHPRHRNETIVLNERAAGTVAEATSVTFFVHDEAAEEL